MEYRILKNVYYFGTCFYAVYYRRFLSLKDSDFFFRMVIITDLFILKKAALPVEFVS